MTIADHITEQVGRLDLDKLTPDQREWLHYMRSLATWAYIAGERRKLDAKKAELLVGKLEG
jgi:hypothetical protein